MRKISLIAVTLLMAMSLFAIAPKSFSDISITPSVPVSVKGFSYDPASPYLPPVSGLGHNNNASGALYSVYVPADFQPWSPGVIILVPDGISAESFSYTETGRKWMAAADKYGFAVGYVESAGDGWGKAGRDEIEAVENVYTQMRSKSKALIIPFTMDKSRVSLVGYGEGAAQALISASGSTSCFAGTAVIDPSGVDIGKIKSAGEEYCFPFPGDGMKAKEEVALVSGTLAMPIWLIGDVDEEVTGYFKAKNTTDSYTANSYASVAYDSSDTVRSVWRTAKSDGLDPEIIWTEFLSKHTRPLGIEGGHLAYATEFLERTDGTGYIVTEETYEGLERKYMTYVPSSYDESQPSPLVLVLHGYTATMYALAEESRWADIAEETGAIIVYGHGYVDTTVNPGNIPAPAWVSANLFPDSVADDVSFLGHVLEETLKNYNIDRTRVYGTGHSNGCVMTLALASERPDLFTAIAPIGYLAAGTAETLSSIVPVSIYYGQYDSAYSEAGYASAVSYWTRQDGAEGEPERAEDGRFTVTTYFKGDAPLVQFTLVANSAHSYFPEESHRIWDGFFSHYTKVDGKVFYDGVEL